MFVGNNGGKITKESNRKTKTQKTTTNTKQNNTTKNKKRKTKGRTITSYNIFLFYFVLNILHIMTRIFQTHNINIYFMENFKNKSYGRIILLVRITVTSMNIYYISE